MMKPFELPDFEVLELEIADIVSIAHHTPAQTAYATAISPGARSRFA